MAKILTKKWKDYKAKKPMCLLPLEERRRIRAERKTKTVERKEKEDEIRNKKRAYIQQIKQAKEAKKAKRKQI